MEWLAYSGPAGEAPQPFEVLRDAPAQLTKRLKTIRDTDKDREQFSLDLDLKAFPPLHQDETREQRGKRMLALDQVWQDVQASTQGVLDRANEDSFNKIATYVFKEHENLTGKHGIAARQRIVPAALAISGSINPSDHAGTFPALVQALRDKGCFAALVGARDLPAGGCTATALHAIIRQFSGLDTIADDMQALLAWYRDELGLSKSQPESKDTGPNDILSPLRKMALQTPQKATRSKASGSQSQSGDQVTSPFGKLALQTPQTEKLRSRTRHQSHPPTQTQEAESAEEAVQAPAKPLVVLVEGAEAVDTSLLQDLILVISENHEELPVILILGMATSAAALDQVLTTGTSDLLSVRSFPLVQALSKLELVFKDVLLSGQTAFCLGHSLLKDLDDQFMHHDFAIRSFMQGLKLAFYTHFQSQEFSYLLTASESDISREIESLPKAARQRLLQLLDLPVRSSHAAASLQEGQGRAAEWKLAVKLVRELALALGYKAVADGFSFRELYREASSPTFAECSRRTEILSRLDQGIQRMDESQALDALHRLDLLSEDAHEASQLATKVRQSKATLASEDSAQADVARIRDGTGSAHCCDLGHEEETQQTKPYASKAGARQGEGSRRPPEEAKHSMDKGRGQSRRRKALAQAVQKAPGEQHGAVSELRKLLLTILESLSKPPMLCPGSAAFCIGGDRTSRKHFTFAPRSVLDSALSHPEQYLGGQDINLCPEQLDTVIAYQLLLESGEEVDIMDWFTSYCTIFTTEGGREAHAPELSPAKKPRRGKGRPRGSRKVFQDGEANVRPAAVKAARKSGRKTGADSHDTDGHEAEHSSAEQTEAKQAVGKMRSLTEEGFILPLEELVSRFTRASNELQLMGMVKADPRKRRGKFAQRLIWGNPVS